MTPRVERLGAGIETGLALIVRTPARNAKAKMEERNIRALILQKCVLSCGNWGRRAGSAEAEPRRPRQERREGHIEKSRLEHEQERYRQELTVHDREPNKVAEINRKRELGEGKRRS